MPQFAKRLFIAVAGTVVAILLNGCAYNKVGISYVPQPNPVAIASAAQVPVNVEVKDVRLTKAVGDFTFETDYTVGGVTFFATNDVVAVVKQAVEEELANRGFKRSENGVNLLVGLETLYDAYLKRSTFIFAIQIRKSDGTIVYSKFVTANAKNVAGSRTVGARLNEALQNGITQLFADQSFIDALLKASASP